MDAKKNPEVNLERKKGLFLQIGLVISLLLVLGAFEYRSYEKEKENIKMNWEGEDQEEIPPTKQEVKPPPPPPPPVIAIVEDEVEIEEDKKVEMEDTDSDEDEFVPEVEEEDDEDFFMVVENMPEFPGGNLGLMQYIIKNVRYPPIAKEYNITGKVYVRFIVEKSGSVTNVTVARGVDKNLDAEAVRVVKSLPKYKPGKKRGEPVRVMFTIPINFTLN